MCNLYSITTNQAAIAALFRVVNRYVGNLAPMPGVFPQVTVLICPHGGRYSNGPSRRRKDRREPATPRALLSGSWLAINTDWNRRRMFF